MFECECERKTFRETCSGKEKLPAKVGYLLKSENNGRAQPVFGFLSDGNEKLGQEPKTGLEHKGPADILNSDLTLSESGSM